MGLQNRMMGYGTTATAQPLQRAQRCWIRPVLARKQVQALAFRLATAPPQQPQPAHQEGCPTVLLPLDFYACLGVTRTAGSRAVRDALDKALLKRPEAYFSSDTVALRDLLLRNAAECLLNYEKRREYDAKALSDNGYVVSVSEYHLPGALVLLQESGYHHLVLDLGTQWLSDNRQDPRRRDVSAVTALAHYGLAVEHLQQDTGCMLEACRHLESALVLIRQCCRNSEDASTAADLQRDVLQLLKDYSPDYCLALLALPLADPQRQRGLTLMRKLLLELPEELSPLGADKDDFLVAARTLMTAQEHLNLYASIATSCISMQQQQLMAEATVALAFQQRNPVRMLQAAGAFKLLDQAVAKEGGGADLCVEHACIALLLGNTPKALQELGLRPEGHADSSSATQQAAQQYVLAHCQDRTDLLPGVYALAQCWVQQGILGGFRQVAAAVDGGQEQQQEAGELDLTPWFDSLRVRLLILVLAFVTKAKQCLEAVIGLPAAVMASMAWLQRSTGTSHHAQHAAASSSTSSEPPADSKCTQPAAAPAEPQANSTTEHSGMSRTSSSSSSSKGRSTSAVTAGSATGASSSSSGRNGVGHARSAASAAVNQESTLASDPAGRMQAATANTPNSQQQKQPADTSIAQRKQQGRVQQGRVQQPADSKSSAAEDVAPDTPAPHAVQVQHDRQGPHPGPLGSSPQQEQHQAVPQQQHAASRVQGRINGSAAAKLKGKLGAGVKGQAQAPPSAAAPESQAVARVGPPGAAEAPSLMARARAAATNKQGAAGALSSVDDDAGPEPSPGQRKRLSRQMVSLEAQMWDPAPEEPKWKAAALKVLPLLVVGAAVVLAASTRQPPAASLPQGALLIDSRG